MSGLGHFLHFIMCLLTGFIWLPVWLICALCIGASSRKRMERKKDQELELLKELNKNMKRKV